MAGATRASRSREAWALARAQHAVLTRSDLLGLGFSKIAIEHRVATGRLHPIARGVYAVGRAELSREGRWMAATLACGGGAVLSHRSAAELWGIGHELERRIHVTIRRRSGLARRGIKVHTRTSLDASSFVLRLGIPVTDPIQTLIDLATELKPLRLERAVNEADKHDLVDPERLRRALGLEVYAGMPGAGTLRTMRDACVTTARRPSRRAWSSGSRRMWRRATGSCDASRIGRSPTRPSR